MDDGSMQVATMDVDGTDLRILTSGDDHEFPDWSPDGSWLVCSHEQDADLVAINRECPVSDSLLTLGIREQSWRMDAEGSDRRLLGDHDGVDSWPQLSPASPIASFWALVMGGAKCAPPPGGSKTASIETAVGSGSVCTPVGSTRRDLGPGDVDVRD